MRILRDRLNLDILCGYVTLLRLNTKTSTTNIDTELQSSISSSSTKDPRKVPSRQDQLASNETMNDWMLFDCVFGIPLFDQQLNRRVCEQIRQCQLFNVEK